jgi:hypothetical protein
MTISTQASAYRLHHRQRQEVADSEESQLWVYDRNPLRNPFSVMFPGPFRMDECQRSEIDLLAHFKYGLLRYHLVSSLRREIESKKTATVTNSG